jgi:hypothetical protein
MVIFPLCQWGRELKKTLFCLLIIGCVSCTSLKSMIAGKDPNDTRDNLSLSGWSNFNKLTLKLNPDRGDYLFLIFDRYKDSDLKIDIENATKKGTLLVLNNRYMLTQGLDLRPGYEIDILDQPLLTEELVLKLFYASMPQGPPVKQGTYVLDHIDNFHSLHVSTKSTWDDYSAPWDIKGNLDCIEPGSLSFKFSVNFLNKKRPYEILGEWIAQASTPASPDDMSLMGWKVYKLGHYKKEIKDEEVYLYGATEVLDFKTLGQVREASKNNIEKTQGERVSP